MHIEDRTVKPVSLRLKAFLSATDDTPMEDGWEAHGIWAPGVQLMRRIKFAYKAAVIAALFLMPMVVLSYIFVKSQNELIDFSAKERVGVATMHQFIPVFEGVLQTRNATRALLGKFEGTAHYNAGRLATDKALSDFDKYLKAQGDTLLIKPEFEKLKAAWATTSQSTNGANSEGRTVFGPVTASIVQILNLIGDNSNLVLDPDLDSFYLVSPLVLAVPQLAEDLGQLWGWGTYAIAHPGLSVPDEKRYTVWAAGVENGLRQTTGYFERAFAANPTLKTKIDMTALTDVQAFYAKAKDPESLITNKELTAALYFDQGKTAVSRLLAVYDKGLPALDGLLEARISAMQTRLLWLVLGMTVSIVLAIYFFFSFFFVTRGGIDLISKHLNEMSEGDLRTPPRKPLGQDESAKLIEDLRVAYDALHMLIRKVRHSARALHSAAGEISSASLDLGGRTESAAAALEQQASAMEEIGSTVRSTAERSQMAATFAVDNAQVAEKGGAVFEEVVSTMRNIHTSSTKIHDIISVIDGIAFQTNILALNAAVEAARAGEAGRGFAVVASEVRTLAQRSAGAAREIKNLISSSVEQVEGGTRVVQAAGQTMSEVVANARQINQFLSEIAIACQEQALGVAEVALSIQELDKHTQQNAALVEETNAAAASLTQQADELQAEIANFRVA